MAEFVRQVSVSEYSNGIFATTSLSTLWIAQTAKFEPFRNMLTVDFDEVTRKFRIAYIETKRVDKRWVKESNEAEVFSAFQHVLNTLAWFI